MTVVLMLGSGPTAPEARDWDRGAIDTILAINNAHLVRPDWDLHIYPWDFPEDRRPVPGPGQRAVTQEDFVPAQNAFGGFVYAGGTMAFTAAYWALHALRPRTLAVAQGQRPGPADRLGQTGRRGRRDGGAAHDAGGVEPHLRTGPLRMAAVDVRRYQRLHQGNPDATQCGGEDQPRTVRSAPAQGTGQRHQREPERYATALAQLRLQHGAAKCAESHGSDGQGGKCACTGAAQTGRGLDFIE